jgi:hypothetical protein
MTLWGALTMALTMTAGHATEETPSTPETPATDEITEATGMMALPTMSLPTGKWLYDRVQTDPRPYTDGLLFDGIPGKRYFKRKSQRWLEHGFDFGGYYSANAQWGSQGGPSHSISELVVLATWEPLRTDHSAGRLVAGFAHDYTFGHPTTRKFANNQGLVETPNDLDTDPNLSFTTLALLHWEHEIATGPGTGWAYRAGQLFAPMYFGVARYLDDDRSFFMARPLAAAAGAQWSGFNDIGLGLNIIGWMGPLYVSVAAMDGKANRKYPQWGSLMDAQLLYLLEAGWQRDEGGPNERAARLTLSHLDVLDGPSPKKGPGQSAMLSAHGNFSGRWGLAGRWSKSYERLSSDYRELLSLAVLWLEPFSRPHDNLGFGVFAGDPSDPDRDVESGFEVFYKARISQALSLTPDIQYWSTDGATDRGTHAWVGGLRLNFEF